jgi:hypothetical protein
MDALMFIYTLHNLCPVTTHIFSLTALRFSYWMLPALVVQFVLFDLLFVVLDGVLEIDLGLFLLRSLI